MALDGKTATAQGTVELPFGGLGVCLEACADYAGTLQARFLIRDAAFLCDGMAFHEPPLALFGYRLLTALGREIRGR